MDAPRTSVSKRSVRTSRPSTWLYRPIAIRWRRSVGNASIAVCSTANDVKTPSSSVSNLACSVLTPDVCSHSCAQSPRSRPDASSSSASRSVSSVLENACLVKYARRPAKKSFSPTQATSCLSADAPLA